MRLSIALLIGSLLGVSGGAALIGLPAVGGAIIFDSLCVGVWALGRDDGQPDAAPQATWTGPAVEWAQRASRRAVP